MTLIIDGHNLIGTGLLPGINLGDADDEWQLTLRLRTYAAARNTSLTVVFDPGAGPGPNWELSGGAVTVRFAPPGVKADALIVQLVKAGSSGKQPTVVTDDRALAGMVRAAGGQVRSATGFAKLLASGPRTATTAVESGHDPRDPAFADIYRGFVEVDKDAQRFGGDISLDADAWIERLYEGDTQEASRAAHWLGRFGGPASFVPLMDALTHRHGQVRAAALLGLGSLGDRQAVEAAADRLSQDPSAMVREAAAQCLALLGGVAAEAALEAATSDHKPKVRKAAEDGLAQVRARQSRSNR